MYQRIVAMYDSVFPLDLALHWHQDHSCVVIRYVYLPFTR